MQLACLKGVIFEQVHTPGERIQSGFTYLDEPGITLAGSPFPHLLFHSVLTYSNVEAVSLCFGETFEALAEGIEKALWQFWGVPRQHRTVVVRGRGWPTGVVRLSVPVACFTVDEETPLMVDDVAVEIVWLGCAFMK